jgi:hypothetical protein
MDGGPSGLEYSYLSLNTHIPRWINVSTTYMYEVESAVGITPEFQYVIPRTRNPIKDRKRTLSFWAGDMQ